MLTRRLSSTETPDLRYTMLESASGATKTATRSPTPRRTRRLSIGLRTASTMEKINKGVMRRRLRRQLKKKMRMLRIWRRRGKTL